MSCRCICHRRKGYIYSVGYWRLFLLSWAHLLRIVLHVCYSTSETLLTYLWCSRNYIPSDQDGRFNAPQQWQFSHGYSQLGFSRRRTSGAVIDPTNLRSLEEKRYLFFPISLLLRNARPVGHHVIFLDFFLFWSAVMLHWCFGVIFAKHLLL